MSVFSIFYIFTRNSVAQLAAVTQECLSSIIQLHFPHLPWASQTFSLGCFLLLLTVSRIFRFHPPSIPKGKVTYFMFYFSSIPLFWIQQMHNKASQIYQSITTTIIYYYFPWLWDTTLLS